MAKRGKATPLANRKTFTSKKLTFLDRMCRDARIKPYDFRIGFLIMQHVNARQGYAFPSGERLVKESKMSIGTVKAAVGHLVDLGYFRISRPSRSSSNHYHPNLDIALLEALKDLGDLDGQ
jgi:hypothetical protein